jgi:hypothetical protein
VRLEGKKRDKFKVDEGLRRAGPEGRQPGPRPFPGL